MFKNFQQGIKNEPPRSRAAGYQYGILNGVHCSEAEHSASPKGFRIWLRSSSFRLHPRSRTAGYSAKENKSAQVTVSEYVLVLFVVMAMMASMTIYFRRAVQAKIYDARNAMLRMVYLRNYEGNMVQVEYDHDFVEYEPYYTNTDSIIAADATQTTRLVPSPFGEQYFKDFQEYTNTETMSQTAPPKDAGP